MTTTNRFSVIKRIFAVSLIFLASLAFAEENPKWTIAAQKFEYAKGQSVNAVSDSTAEMLPSRILEKIGQNLIRNVSPDERLNRFYSNSRKERMSLFLQLSGAYKKRNSLLLNNYSKNELEKKILEEEKNIKGIQKKIDENLELLKQEEEKTEKLKLREDKEIEMESLASSELFKYSRLVKNLFAKNESVFTEENIVFYSNDYAALFSPSEKAKKDGYESYSFEKECLAANINTLLTGSITSYGDYLSVTVDLYLYPNAKLIGSVTEIGSIYDYDFISTNIVRELLPLLTNALPVKILVEVEPKEAFETVQLYIDDQLKDSVNEAITVDSGVHSLQFVAEGYKSAATSYFFEGNKQFKIQVKMEPQQTGSMLIGIERTKFDLFFQSLPLTPNYNDEGRIYYNGVATEYDEEGRSKIIINGNKILGQFVSDDGTTDFFYVPPKFLYDSNNIAITPETRDRSKYIDSRRKWMYASYSLLIVSLIPTLYCYGTYENMAKRWNSLAPTGALTADDYEQALKMQKTTRIFTGVSIGCGAFFAFEVFRYFDAANSVLPKKVKKTKVVNPVVHHEKAEDSENPEDSDDTDNTNESEEISKNITDNESQIGTQSESSEQSEQLEADVPESVVEE